MTSLIHCGESQNKSYSGLDCSLLTVTNSYNRCTNPNLQNVTRHVILTGTSLQCMYLHLTDAQDHNRKQLSADSQWPLQTLDLCTLLKNRCQKKQGRPIDVEGDEGDT